MENCTDTQLVSLYQKGKEAALEHLVRRHQTALYRYIFYKVLDHDLANDLFQETFFKVIRTLKQGRYKEEGKFFLWLRRIAQNLIIDYFRSNARRPLISEGHLTGEETYSIFEFLPCPTPNIEETLDHQQVGQDLYYLISQLSDVQQEALKMRFFDGLSFNEIAEQTGCSINTSLGRVRYALMNLRKLIEENQIELLP